MSVRVRVCLRATRAGGQFGMGGGEGGSGGVSMCSCVCV